MLLLRPFEHYADFKGRSGRAEFWLMQLTAAIAVGVPFAIFSRLVEGSEPEQMGGWLTALSLAVVAIVILVTPYNATTVRRLNDTGMSAWWLPLTWTPLVGLAFMVYLGTKTPLSPQPVEAADEPPVPDPSNVAASAQTPADDPPRTGLQFAMLGAAMVVVLCVWVPVVSRGPEQAAAPSVVAEAVADAQNELGKRYEYGLGVAKDAAAAAGWYRKAAEQGHASAQYNLGFMYDNGRGVPQDNAAAASWYRKAAEQGDADAQSSLGLMYGNGQGVPQDYAAAVGWYRKAAEQGGASAQFLLGLRYANVQGVTQDYAAAVGWYRKAAEQGYAAAQYNLGAMYENGEGVAQDYVQAHKWFNLGAASGDVDAVKARDGVAAKMTPAQIAEAQRLASAWSAK